MINDIKYVMFYLLSVFLASISQIILKKSAQKQYSNKIYEYLNISVIGAYIIFFSCTLFTIIALKKIPLSIAPILESTGYIYIAFLSAIFLNEKIRLKKVIGLTLIMVGIITSVI